MLSRSCDVRYIITINALKEGWDCPFAYILASLADKSSAVDVEQILGRVLRQPYVMKHSASLLNVSYVLTASVKFNETLQNIVKGLQAAGFSDRDYRGIDAFRDEKEQQTDVVGNSQESRLFNPTKVAETEPEFDSARISFTPGDITQPETENKVLSTIETLAEEQVEKLETSIRQQRSQPADEQIFEEMGDKVKRYKLVEANRNYVAELRLPQFYLTVQQSDIFGTGKELLSQEPLLHRFKLSNEDTKIDFEQITSDLYKVDIEETGKSEYDARFTKIEDLMAKEPLVEYILSKPKNNQVKDIAHQLIRMIGDMYPIADQEIRVYIERILNSLNAEQLQDILIRKLSYADKIKAKIKEHADNFAESRFNDLIKIGKIQAERSWSFPDLIVPGILGASITKSLYEREGLMNNFETTIIMHISALPNIVFWHRNLGRGKGFSINGYKSNHYPDFIAGTKSGKIILIETKGDDRDNSDSQAKCRLGNKWAELAGSKFNYFMVFDRKYIDGAYNADKALELIRQL